MLINCYVLHTRNLLQWSILQFTAVLAIVAVQTMQLQALSYMGRVLCMLTSIMLCPPHVDIWHHNKIYMAPPPPPPLQQGESGNEWLSWLMAHRPCMYRISSIRCCSQIVAAQWKVNSDCCADFNFHIYHWQTERQSRINHLTSLCTWTCGKIMWVTASCAKW